MKSLFLILLSIGSITFYSCSVELDVTVPDVASLTTLQGTQPIPTEALRAMEGVYIVTTGNQRFGDTVVLKHTGKGLSLFSERNVTYMIFDCGMKDSTLYFAGYWRFAQTAQSGLCTLEVRTNEGARTLLTGTTPPTVIVHGAFGNTESIGNTNNGKGNQNERPQQGLVMKYLRPVFARPKGFWVIAHRGGGRNSDRLPFSENSIELIQFTGRLGANAIEIDVRKSKDGVPILYHDENFNTRLIKGEYLVGPVGNYTYAQMQSLGRLVNGEKIPTLEQALEAVVSKTQLSLVWLDVKDASLTDTIISLQQKYLDKAKQLGRNVEILFGVPAEDIYTALSAHPRFTSVPSVCELSTEQTNTLNSVAYAPRWTLGTMNTTVNELHAKDKRVFVWTLDQPDFIKKFFKEGEFDAMLTNYPTLVAYHYYTKQQ
ncbi:MAG: glycerophosphodiester phosphodiesterase family protein [Candidatus Kapaibacterium sp.]